MNLGQALAPIAEIIGGVLVAAFNLLLEVVAAVMPHLGEIVGNVVDAITAEINMIADVIRGMTELVTALINGDWDAAWNAAGDIILAFKDGAEVIFNELYDTIAIIFEALVEGVINWLNNINDGAGDKFAAFLEKANQWGLDFVFAVKDMLQKVLSAIKNFSLKEAGADLINGMIDGIKSKAGELATAASKVVKDAIDAAKAALRIKSPSRVFFDIGTNTIKGLIMGIQSMDTDAAKAMAQVVSSVVSAAQGLLDLALDLADFTVPGGTYQTALDWLADFAERLARAVASIKDAGIDFGDDFKAFAANLKASFGPLVEALKLVDKMQDFAWLKPGTSVPIIGWLASFTGIVAQEMTRISQWKNIGLGNAFQDFAKNLKASFGPLMEALRLVEKMQSFKWIEPGTGVPIIEWLASFSGIVGREMSRISGWKNINFGDAFQDFANNLRSGFGPLMDALKLVEQLRSFEWLEPGTVVPVIEWLASFSGIVAQSVSKLQNWQGIDFGESFTRFTNGIKESFAALDSAIKFIDNLNAWKGAKGLKGKFTAFRKDWEFIIIEFGKSVSKLKGLVKDDLAEFAKVMGDIAGGLLDAVELLKTDWSEVTVPPATLWKPLFEWILDVMTEASRYAKDDITPEALDAASVFGGALGTLVGGLSNALSFITDLMTTPSGVLGDAEAFADAMGLLLQRIDGTIKAFKVYVVDREGDEW